jgi:Caspase domain
MLRAFRLFASQKAKDSACAFLYFLATWLMAPLMALLVGTNAISQTTQRQDKAPRSPSTLVVKEKRIALVIGNSAYPESPLPNPVNDANDIAQTLRFLNFEVMAYPNLGLQQMKAAIRTFGDKIQAGGTALFFFAGHGIQIKGINYLVPVDARIRKESDVEIECLMLDAVLGQLERQNTGTNLVILDACRNNPFAVGWRSPARGLAPVAAPTGTFVAYATAPGSVSSDGSGRNGLYTQELLKILREPALPIEEAFKKVRVGVKAISGGKQIPWEHSSLEGPFCFDPARTCGGSRLAINNSLLNVAPQAELETKAPVLPLPNKPAEPVNSPSNRSLIDSMYRNYYSDLMEQVIQDAVPLLKKEPQNHKVAIVLGGSYLATEKFNEATDLLVNAVAAGETAMLRVYKPSLSNYGNDGYEGGWLKFSKQGLELRLGKNHYTCPLGNIRGMFVQTAGASQIPGFTLVADWQENNGKPKEKRFFLIGPMMQYTTVQRRVNFNYTATEQKINCPAASCESWAKVVINLINRVPR